MNQKRHASGPARLAVVLSLLGALGLISTIEPAAAGCARNGLGQCIRLPPRAPVPKHPATCNSNHQRHQN